MRAYEIVCQKLKIKVTIINFPSETAKTCNVHYKIFSFKEETKDVEKVSRSKIIFVIPVVI
jgi:hypothetical protein